MDSPEKRPISKRIVIVLALMAIIVFALFVLPNSVASQNLAMVQIFEPDEAAALPYLFKMFTPAKTLYQTLHNFIFYDWFYYGFPYFFFSALAVIPVKLAGRLNDIPTVMLVLRQVISVLPMLAALLLLVYMQDGFRTYRSPVLFAVLLAFPAISANNFWWHPDGLVVLLAVLTLFFLRRDRLRFGWNFLIAAVMCGVAAATKLVGLYFFGAIGLALVLGLALKKASWKRLAAMAAVFLVVMGVSFLAANPYLLSIWALRGYITTFRQQTFMLEEGYGVVYSTGLLAAWPQVQQYYGQAAFVLLGLGTAIWGALRGPQRLLHALILAWFVPVSYTVFFVTHFKFQYWLPVAMPLFSSLAILLPEKMDWREWKARLFSLPAVGRLLLVAGVLVQAGFFVAAGVPTYIERLHRADSNDSVQFYSQALVAVQPLASQPVFVYHDYRMYFPDTLGWSSETTFDLLNYQYIRQRNFGVLLLMEQRIRDYLNPNVQGIDPETFAYNQQFYRDADQEKLTGYTLVYRNDFGLVFVRQDLYQQYFQK